MTRIAIALGAMLACFAVAGVQGKPEPATMLTLGICFGSMSTLVLEEVVLRLVAGYRRDEEQTGGE